MNGRLWRWPGLLTLLVAGGCASPYYADRGAALGALGGAATGAVVGNQLGSTVGGALIGGAVGAVGGAAVGSALDEVEAKNRAEIEARLGRPLPPGGVTVDDIIAMHKAGLPDDVIVTHINAHGMAYSLAHTDLIRMQEAGISSSVMQAAQRPPVRVVRQVPPPPQAVIVEEYHYGVPCHPHRHYYYHPGHAGRARLGWGVSIESYR
jgi:hypothetical protein